MRMSQPGGCTCSTAQGCSPSTFSTRPRPSAAPSTRSARSRPGWTSSATAATAAPACSTPESPP
ncbi:hypothetical protein X805_36400 [Sphaerotilus natans subsp. natans DSM 6575]|uniref:Uncharacterized protein n=1 Tax=Sphaerotilus natans subsp. natans DSM 6575 TaxID=1286631 RepID=A0A059KH15_9BURK|nr:hypothetical protein X805_36400 [Sphaerotilus natans subsp. natans DSM 6575]